MTDTETKELLSKVRFIFHQMKKETEVWLTPEQVEKDYGYAPATLKKMRLARELKKYRFHKKKFQYSQSELEDLFQQA